MHDTVRLQDVIQFGPLVKTLGLVMLNRPQILPSIFKQVDFGNIVYFCFHTFSSNKLLSYAKLSSEWPGIRWSLVFILLLPRLDLEPSLTGQAIF